MDPLQDLRWQARSARTASRSVAGRFLLAAVIAVAVVTLAAMTDELAPPVWPVIAVLLQRFGIGMALICGAYSVVFWLDSRRSGLGEPRAVRGSLVIALIVVVLVAVLSFWLW